MEYRIKKALIISAKDWDKKDIHKLTEDIRSRQYRWRGKALTPEGETKYFFAYTEVDTADFCYERGWKLLEVKLNNLR